MMDMSEFHFLQPWALISAAVLIGLAVWALNQRPGGQVWQQLFNAQLLPRFLVTTLAQSSRRAVLLAVLAATLLALALAQPVWRKLPEPVFETGTPLVIALDLSASMEAEDVVPSRLGQARFKIRDLLAARKEGQTALLVYAGDAFTVSPLTDDTDTLVSQQAVLEPGILPVQGSRPGQALEQARQLLSQAGIRGGDILLMADELKPTELAAQLEAITADGHRVSVLSFGTAAGAPVPGLRYPDGKPVIAATDFSQMKAVAQEGNGIAIDATADNSDIAQLNRFLARQGTTDARATDREHDQWVAEGSWLVLLALPLLLPLFRRGLLSVALVFALSTTQLVMPQPVMAAEAPDESTAAQLWQNLWQTQDQQAMEKWRAGDSAAAATQFQQPDWQQAARYRQQDYQGALEALPEPEDADQWYNRGNSLARLGRFDEALKAYDEALALNPEDADSQANRALVEEALEQLKQQGQSGQQGQPGKGDEQQQSAEGEQNDSQQSGSESGESSDGEQSADQNGGESESESEHQQAENDEASSAAQGGDDQSEQSESQQAAAGSEADEQQQQEASEAFGDALEQAESGQDEQSQQAAAEADMRDEAKQAREQMLNRVVDDPAGLWRRKFLYQYQQRAEPLPSGEQPW